MMAQKSLSNLIKIIIIFTITLPISFAFLIDDFEDVSDWTPSADITTFTLEDTIVKFGSFSGDANVTTNADGSGELTKNLDSSIDALGINFSIWVYIDLDIFTLDPPLEIQIVDNTSTSCDMMEFGGVQNWEIFAANLVDETWTQVFSENTADISSPGCDFTNIKRVDIFVATDPPSAGFPFSIYFDNFEADSCSNYNQNNWRIRNADACTLNITDSITGNLNISNGSLEIQDAGLLTVSGGFAYVYPQSNLTILSGGQING